MDCPFCFQKITLWVYHASSCQKLPSNYNPKLNHISFGENVFCTRCLVVLKSHEFENHRKTYHKKQYGNSKSTKSENVIIQKQYITQKQSFGSFSGKQSVQNYAEGISMWARQFLAEWLNKTGHLTSLIRWKIIHQGLYGFGKKLDSSIPQLKIETLYKKFGEEIKGVVNQVSDIFNINEVQKKIELKPISAYKKKQLYTLFNTFLAECNSKERYKIQYKPQKIITYSLYFKELSQFVAKLFQTKQRQKIHFGLDLLILYHCCQRFPSSIELITKSIVKLMKQKKLLIEPVPYSTKTSLSSHIIINEELKRLLNKFHWKQFLFTRQQYGRMIRFTNFSAKCLRAGMIDEQMYVINNFEKMKKLSDHRTKKALFHYAGGYMLDERLCYHDYASLPKNKKEYQFIDQIDERILKKIYPTITNEDYFTDKTQIQWQQFYISPEVIEPTAIIPNLEENMNQLEQQQQQQQVVSLMKKKLKKQQSKQKNLQQFSIRSRKYHRVQGKFQLTQNFFSNKLNQVCVFCLKQYEVAPSFCDCCHFEKKTEGLKIKCSKKQQKIKISMPHQYLKNEELFNQVRFFLHCRGGFVTNVGVSKEEIKTQVYQNQEQVQLEHYEEYKNGKYFPPIQLQKSGEQNEQGSGVGLFALNKINKGTFIGQYGGDIIPFSQTILLRRLDMCMILRNSEKIQIGSKNHTSYIQLLNSSSKGNCIQKKCIFEGRLIIIIVADVNISVGQELTYNYKGEFKFNQPLANRIQKQEQDIIKSSQPHKKVKITQESNYNQIQSLDQVEILKYLINPIEKDSVERSAERQKNSVNPEIQKFKKQISIQIAVNSCYADASIVIFKLLKEYFFSQSTSIAQEILAKKTFKTKKWAQKFTKERQFDEQKQQDFDQFFRFVQDELSIDNPIVDTTFIEKTQCTKCKTVKSYPVRERDFNFHELQLKLQTAYEIQKKCCCDDNVVHKVQRFLQSSPHLLVFSFPAAYFGGGKKLNIINIPNFLQHKNIRYSPKIILYHQGQISTAGHYTVREFKSNVVFSLGKFRNYNPQIDYYVSLVIFEKEKQFTQFQQEELQKSGIYFEGEGKKYIHNIENYYNIASIVKLITFMTCESMRRQNKLQMDHRFTAPRCGKLFGTMSGLVENHQYSIRQLYSAMLIASGCDAAYTLCVNFGYFLTGSKNEERNEKIFVDEMQNLCYKLKLYNTFIEDACGLKRNTSCVQDLLLILDECFNYKELKSFLGQPIYQGKNNTNELFNKLPGKTGTHREGVCFMGKNQKYKVVMLDVRSHPTLFEFLRRWIRK